MAAGPGSVTQTTTNPDPLLWYATENDVVEVYNPLSEDFIGLVGQTQSVNRPFEIRKTPQTSGITKEEGDVAKNYGLSLKNNDHPAAANFATKLTLKAGSTTSLLGGVAKVIVNQLVTEIMQRERNSLKMADPTARLEVERRVVRSQAAVQDYLPSSFKTEQEQVHEAINNVNEQNNEQQPFPTETGEAGTSRASGSTDEDRISERRGPGRPKKS